MQRYLNPFRPTFNWRRSKNKIKFKLINLFAFFVKENKQTLIVNLLPATCFKKSQIPLYSLLGGLFSPLTQHSHFKDMSSAVSQISKLRFLLCVGLKEPAWQCVSAWKSLWSQIWTPVDQLWILSSVLLSWAAWNSKYTSQKRDHPPSCSTHLVITHPAH